MCATGARTQPRPVHTLASTQHSLSPHAESQRAACARLPPELPSRTRVCLTSSCATPQSPWYSGHNNWHPALWLKNEKNLWTKYSHSFFWGAGMVTSMVPRDIEPVTSLEAFVTTFTMFGGLLLNAFVISSLTAALSSMNAKKEFASKQLEAIKSFLLIKSVPSEIRHRILEYYEYHFTSSAALAELNMFSRCACSSSSERVERPLLLQPLLLQMCTI